MLWLDNEYGTHEQDARRRDFTVNALYYDDSRPADAGGVVDFCGGLDDLESGTVRAIGDPEVRLAEDPVRILRALKLVAQYGFGLESGLAAVVRSRAALIRRSSQARLYEEFLKILAKPFSCRTLEVCHEYGLLEHWLPGVARRWDAPPGHLMRRLMRERDRRNAAGDYSRSRALAIATLVLGFVAEALGATELDGLWEHSAGLERPVRDTVRGLLTPLPVPKALTARARDIILMLPRFATTAHKKRLLHHADYRYARELYALAAKVQGWDEAVLVNWPRTGHAPPVRRSRWGRQKHVRRSHRKQWNEP
jgi:poly(A) polymerase